MPHPLLESDLSAPAIPIRLATEETWSFVSESLPAEARAFAAATGFEPKSGRHAVLPGPNGAVAAVVLGVENGGRVDPFMPGKLATSLPDGLYRFVEAPADPALATLAWLLGAYRFDRYKTGKPRGARLVTPEGADSARVTRMADAVGLGRDLVNTPANDLGPDGLEAAARSFADRRGMSIAVTVGDDLLARNFPMIHAVGRASATPPRLVDLTWGDPSAPKVTLVGKGVTFDTGGLNIKPDNSMALMKKDMGGAAAALAAADMIVDAGLPVRLRVLLPIVENAISGSSFRPGDILPSRKGLTVEIGNTDAEGRLILADALALAEEEEPDLLVDFATLTGAARVALGPDLPPFFTDDDALAADLARIATIENDPAWRLPLWGPYDSMLDSKIADVNHISGGPFAGSITAALFLRRFARAAKAHVHFDIYGWIPAEKPGRPFGGEVQSSRLIYALVEERYAKPLIAPSTSPRPQSRGP
jgi:leucyl aminopeptidase